MMSVSEGVPSSLDCSEYDGEMTYSTREIVHQSEGAESLAHYRGLQSLNSNGHSEITAMVGKIGDDPNPETNSSGGCATPVSDCDSVDLLAEKLSKVGDDGEANEVDVVPHDARKIAKKYVENKDELQKLKVIHDNHLSVARSLQSRVAQLESELEQLERANKEEDRERLEHVKALIEMLTYGTQGKCGVCKENSKIIESHPYSRVVLETVLGANYSGILDLQQDTLIQPSSCKWKHLCGSCDKATGNEEKKFKDYLANVLKNPKSAVSKTIPLSHADLFHVYTFRALHHNVDTHHYIPGCEEQECTCTELFHSLNDFRKRAHHLSQPFVWKDRPSDESITITPSEAGLLFHVQHTEDHWLEFPLICKVNFEHNQRSHYLIFAQIPPFYWAFPLPLNKQNVPATITVDKKNSKILVEMHYPEALRDAKQLSKYFEPIIAEINKELEARRRSLDDRLQKWHDDLQRKKQEINKEAETLEAEIAKCKEEEENLNQKIEESEKKWAENKGRLKEIQNRSEVLEKKEKETCITSEKKSCLRQLENLIAKQRQTVRENQELNKEITKYTDESEKNVSKREVLLRKKSELIKSGLHAKLEPKLLVGYFRTHTRCCLEVTLR